MVLSLAACAHSRINPVRTSSVGSTYSPAGRFWGTVSMTDSAVLIHVDSGLIADGGQRMNNPPASLASLGVTALLVATEGTGWRELERSAELRVADTIRYGESAELPRHTFDVPRPQAIPFQSTWIVFELRSTPLLLGRRRMGLTYACSATNLRGAPREAKRRAEALKQSYLAVCQPAMPAGRN
jgi:hypothetical protein